MKLIDELGQDEAVSLATGLSRENIRYYVVNWCRSLCRCAL